MLILTLGNTPPEGHPGSYVILYNREKGLRIIGLLEENAREYNLETINDPEMESGVNVSYYF